MAVFPAAAVFILIWLWQSFKDPDRGTLVMLAALPFGMFAAVSVSGLSILASHLLAVLTLSVYVLRRASGGIGQIQIPPAGVYFLMFALYALFSAIVLVRIFAGELLVFPMNIGHEGLRLSHAFASSLKPLTPSNSNIAQSGYILISVLVFIMLADVCRRRGVEYVERGIVWAAGLNIFLAALDLAGLDAALALIRTADYTLLNEQTMLGMQRVIGGYSEASAFGGASAVFFAYFGMAYMVSRKKRDGVLALGNLLFGLLSLSTTSFAAFAAACFFIMLHAGSFLGRGLSRSFAHWLVIGLAVAVMALSLIAAFTPFVDLIAGLIDNLFVQKATSLSGMERGAWAAWGLNAFVETYGLGAGAGSLRSNGMVAVFLGSVGLPGTLLFIAFLWNAIGPTGPRMRDDVRRVFVASRVAVLTVLSGAMLSSTTPDPGMLLVSAAAMAAACRQQSTRALRASAGQSFAVGVR